MGHHPEGPSWGYPITGNRIAPVVLLTDSALRAVMTPNRAREGAFTPRGGTFPKDTDSHVGQSKY